MLYLAVGYDVHALVEVDLIACARTAVYYLLGHRFKVLQMPLRSVDEVVSSLTVEAIHSPLCKAAVEGVVPATAMDVVGAIVGVGTATEATAPQGVVCS